MIVPVPSNYASDPEVSLGFMSNTQRKEFYSVSLYYFFKKFFCESSMEYCHWIFLTSWPVASNDKLSAKKRLGSFSIW